MVLEENTFWLVISMDVLGSICSDLFCKLGNDMEIGKLNLDVFEVQYACVLWYG